MSAKIQGNVMLEGIVGTDGAVTGAKVIRSLDAVYGLDDQALKAFVNYRFTPGTLNGTPVPVIVAVSMSFNLR